MQSVAIIGAGISGLSSAHFLKDRYNVSVFEKESRPGGLIKCRRVNGSLFFTCGGHVFNSKRKDVLDWFWSIFNQTDEFSLFRRNSCVAFDANKWCSVPLIVPYPIENHIYLFDDKIQRQIYSDLDEIDTVMGIEPSINDYGSLGDFLRWRFGQTLNQLYFQPYNEKIWHRDLTTIPISWMEGKLPMPTTQEIRIVNATQTKENTFVHSTFWCEKNNGSQLVADKLSEDLNIHYECAVDSISLKCGKWEVLGQEFDKVIFCGNIKDLPRITHGVDLNKYKLMIAKLQYHGTTSVFCEIDKNPYSWIYQPSHKHQSHRIICTGNFASSNNAPSLSGERMTATIEITDVIDKKHILQNLEHIPFNPKYIDHECNVCTYPIQDRGTRQMLFELKHELSQKGLFITGRFADWEYYNMDTAIGAAMDTCKNL